jgi:hypothetical protein
MLLLLFGGTYLDFLFYGIFFQAHISGVHHYICSLIHKALAREQGPSVFETEN